MAKDLEVKILSRWQNMMMRCYDEEWKAKNPRYHDAEVCEEWHDYPTFRAWAIGYIKQIELGWDMDKDLMSGEHRIYSPSTCVFLPSIINRTLPKCKIWEDGRIDGKSAHTMYEFALALEGGKDLIPSEAYEKLSDIVNGYKALYLERTGRELAPIPPKERKSNRGGHREGSGRRKLYKKTVTINLSPEAVTILSAVEKKSEYIDDLIIGRNPIAAQDVKTLSDYTDNELRYELERRGYRGTLAKGDILTFGKD